MSFTYSSDEFDIFNSTQNVVKLASSVTNGISPNSYELYMNAPLRDTQSREVIGLITMQQFVTVRYGLTQQDLAVTYRLNDKNFPGGSSLKYLSTNSPQTEGNINVY